MKRNFEEPGITVRGYAVLDDHFDSTVTPSGPQAVNEPRPLERLGPAEFTARDTCQGQEVVDEPSHVLRRLATTSEIFLALVIERSCVVIIDHLDGMFLLYEVDIQLPQLLVGFPITAPSLRYASSAATYSCSRSFRAPFMCGLRNNGRLEQAHRRCLARAG